MKNIIVWLSILLIAGCTIVPKAHYGGPSPTVSETGNADSGIIALYPDHSALITPLRAQQYRTLAPLYGYMTEPQVTEAFGLTDTGTNTFLVSGQGEDIRLQLIALSELGWVPAATPHK